MSQMPAAPFNAELWNLFSSPLHWLASTPVPSQPIRWCCGWEWTQNLKYTVYSTGQKWVYFCAFCRPHFSKTDISSIFSSGKTKMLSSKVKCKWRGFEFLWFPAWALHISSGVSITCTTSGLLISLTQESRITGLYRSYYKPLSDKLDYLLTNMGSQ